MGCSTTGSLGVGAASITETKEFHCYKWKNTHTSVLWQAGKT